MRNYFGATSASKRPPPRFSRKKFQHFPPSGERLRQTRAAGCFEAPQSPKRKWSSKITFPGNLHLKNNEFLIRVFLKLTRRDTTKLSLSAQRTTVSSQGRNLPLQAAAAERNREAEGTGSPSCSSPDGPASRRGCRGDPARRVDAATRPGATFAASVQRRLPGPTPRWLVTRDREGELRVGPGPGG
jgi:hypothetical protein